MSNTKNKKKKEDEKSSSSKIYTGEEALKAASKIKDYTKEDGTKYTGEKALKVLADKELQRITSYLSDTSDTLANVYSGWQNKADMDNYKRKLTDYNKEISNFSKKYGHLYDGITDFSKNLNDALNNWDSLSDYYGYYENKDAFDAAIEDSKKNPKIDLYDPTDDGLKKYAMRYMDSDDFEDVSYNTREAAKAKGMDTAQLDKLFNSSSEVGYYILGKYGEDSEEYQNFLKDSEYFGSKRHQYDLRQKLIYDMVNDPDAIPDWLNEDLENADIPDWFKNNVGPIANTLGFFSPLAQILLNPMVAGQKLIQGEDFDPYSGPAAVANFATDLNQITSESIAKATEGWDIDGTNVPSYLFDTVWSSGIQSYLGAAQFGWAYTPLMGANAYNSTYKEAIERGIAPEEANKTAWAAGIAEAAFETLSIGAFKFLQARNTAGFKDWIFNFLTQGFVEGSEEVTTELANTFTDNWINGEFSKYNQNIAQYKKRGFSDADAESMAKKDLAGDIGKAFVGGAITGGVMSGIQSGVQYHNNVKTGQNINTNQYIADMEQLGQLDPTSRAYRDYQKLTQKYGAELNGVKNGQLGASATNAMMELQKGMKNASKDARKANRQGYITSDDFDMRQENIDRTQNTLNQYASTLNNMYNNANGEFNAQTNSEQTEELPTKAREVREALNIADQTVNEAGEAIQIKNVTEENGVIKVTDQNGNVVEAANAKFSEKDADLVANALTIEDSSKRQMFLENYKGQDIASYVKEFEKIWSEGQNGNAQSITNMRTSTIDQDTARTIAAQSMTYASQSDKKANAMASQVVSQSEKAGIKAGNFDSSSVDMNSLNRTQRRFAKFLEAFSAVTGIDIVITNESSRTQAKDNGWVVTDKEVTINGKTYAEGTVMINLSAKYRVSDAAGSYVTNTIAHEFTHWMHRQMGEEFKILENAVRDSMTEQKFQDLVDIELQRDSSLSEADAIDEVIARSCEDMLNDKDVANRILSNIDTKGLNKLKNAIIKFFDFMSEQLHSLGKLSNQSEAAKAVKQSEEAYNKVKEAWVDLLNRAIANKMNAETSQQTETQTESVSETTTEAVEETITAEEVKGEETATEEVKAEETETVEEDKIYIDNTGAKILGDGMVEMDGDVVKEYNDVAPKIQPQDKSYSQWTATWVDKNGQRWGWFYTHTTKTLSKMKFTQMSDEQFDFGSRFFEALENNDREAMASLLMADRLLKSSQVNDIDTQINQSMTMEECKNMIQRAFNAGGIKEWFEGEYKNGEEWIRGEGADAVALIIDNDYTFQQKYLNKIQGIMDGDFMIEDVLESYLKGTLTGKVKEKAKRLDISKPNTLAKNEFYSPKNIENYKEVYATASQKITKANKAEVMKARANLVIFAHNNGAAELLGISNTELNKKLRQWSNYSARARSISEKINRRAPLQNRWSGIENCSWVNKISVTNEQIDALVGNINGDPDGRQRNYIARTMLALDTHISYKGLNFTFASRPDPSSTSTRGLYRNSDTSIIVKYDAPNTVAHEMGHYLDYQWGRDLGFTTPLTEECRTESRKRNELSAEAKQWLKNFESFLTSIEESSDISNTYSMDSKEVFARFVDKFVRWTDTLAGGHCFSGIEYSDKFTNAQFVEFAVLLQERASLQLEQELEDALGDKEAFAQELRDKGWKEDKIKEVLKRLYPSEQNSILKSSQMENPGININTKTQNFVQQILARKKKIETRDTPSLKAYVGKRVGLIETGNGKAVLRGYATISKEIHYTNELQFRADYSKHLIEPNSPFDYTNSKYGTKYGYVLTDVVRCKPTEIYTRGNVAREVPAEGSSEVQGWIYANIKENSENEGNIQSYKYLKSEKINLTKAEYADAKKQIADDIYDAFNMDDDLNFRGMCYTEGHVVFYESFEDVNPQIVGTTPIKEFYKYATRDVWLLDNINKLISSKERNRRSNRELVTQIAEAINNRGYDRIVPRIPDRRPGVIERNRRNSKETTASNSVRKSLQVDSEGGTLTENQAEYFKDSAVRDDKGNLLVMYHGTDSYNDFFTFKSGKDGYLGPGIYFTDKESFANKYAKQNGYDGRIYKTYLNVKNPLVVTSDTPAKEILGEKVAVRREVKNSFSTKWLTQSDINKLKAKGYDGIIWKYGTAPIEVAVWDSNQIKDVKNLNPTKNPDIRFSKQISTPLDELMDENKNLEKVNAKLTEDIQRLREMIKLDKTITKGNVLNQKHLDSAARAILKEANSKYDAKELSDDLKEIYGYILENSNKTEPLSMDVVMSKCYDLAKRVVKEAQAQTMENPYPKEALNDIRTARISLTDEQIQEAKNYFGDDWRKAFWGRVVIAKDGMSLDSYWQQWSETYPGLGFDYDTNPNDMITRLSEIYDDLKDASELTLERDIRNETLSAAYDIYNKFWTVSTVTTTADKQSAEIKRIKNEHRQAINELKNELKQQKLEGRKALENQKLADDIYFKIKERNAVKNVRDAERAKANERVARQRANDMAYYHEMINRLREQKNQKYAELKEFQKNKDAKRKDVAERRAHIAKITEVSKSLLNWMNHPNVKNGHLIPEAFANPVAYLLNTIDFSSKQMLGLSGGQNAFSPTKKDTSFMNAVMQMNSVVGNIEKMNLEMPTGLIFSSKFYETWASLNEHITQLGLNGQQDNAYILHMMTTEDLGLLEEAVREMKRVITTYNTVLSATNAHSMDHYARNTVNTADAMSAKKVSKSGTAQFIGKFMNYDNSLPYYVFKNMGEGAKFIFGQVAKGWNKYAFNVRTIEKFTRDSNIKGKDIKKWESTVHEFEILMRDKNGNATGDKRTIRMTEAQIMSLYCLAKRNQAVNHILGQGIRIKDFTEGKNTVVQTGNIPLTQTELDNILSVVNNDAEMKRVADAIQTFMNTTCKDWGNEISMKRFDLEAFTEENYFPISVDQNAFAPNDRDSIKSIYALLNMSFTKPLTQNSTKPIELSSIFDVYAQHSEEMAKYNALALPVLDMIKWWGYTVKNEDKTNVSLRESLERAYGKGANTYINHFLADLNAQQEAGRGEGAQKRLLKAYKVSAVAANLQVALLQPISYMRAVIMVSPKYLAYGTMHAPTGIKEMMKYSGIANWKNMGFYDVNISRGLNSIIRQDDNWKQKITEIGLKPAEYGDKITWGALWSACKAQTASETGLQGEALMQATAEKFNEVCYATQVFDSTLSRSDLMRSQSYATQVATAFMSEPTVAYNTLLDIGTRFSNAARTTNTKDAFKQIGKPLVKASFAFLATSALEAIVRASIGKLKDTDDEDEWDELFLAELKSNLLIFNQIPILKDIVAIADDIDGNNTWNNPKRMEYEVFATWAKAVKYIAKVEENGLNYKTVYTIAQALSQATGIPLSGALRSFEEIWNPIIKNIYPDLVIQ